MTSPVHTATQHSPTGTQRLDVVAARATGALDEHWLAEQRRRVRRERLLMKVGKVMVPVVALIVWEMVSGRLVRQFFVSSPSLVFERLRRWAENGTLTHHTWVTLRQAGTGFLLGAGTGVVVGLVLGRLKRLGELLDPLILALYSLPKIALAPLFILWFGIDFRMKVMMSAVLVFFLVFYNTYSGVQSVSESLVNVMRTMGARRRHVMRMVVLPSAGLWVFTGLRISVPYALIGAVVGELVAGSQGIGYLMRRAQSQLDTTGVFAGLIMLMVLSTVLLGILSVIQRRLLRWQVAQVGAVV